MIIGSTNNFFLKPQNNLQYKILREIQTSRKIAHCWLLQASVCLGNVLRNADRGNPGTRLKKVQLKICVKTGNEKIYPFSFCLPFYNWWEFVDMSIFSEIRIKKEERKEQKHCHWSGKPATRSTSNSQIFDGL